MKRTKRIAAVLLLLFCLTLPAGCTGGQSAAALRLTDMMGREVEISGPVERVVAVTAADCEIVYALGAGEAMVGRGEYCDWPQEALEVAAVASGMETNVEQIIALSPQVVFMDTMNQQKEQVDQLTEAGIGVVVSDAKNIADVYESIGIIGQALGRAGEAEALTAEMRQGLEALAAQVPEAEKGQSVYFEVSPLEYGLWAAGGGSFMDEAAELLGLQNIFADLSDWAEVSEEQVIERNPDIIISIAMYFGEGPTPEEEIMSRAAWGDIAAVQNGKVYTIGDNSLSRPGPRLVSGAQQLYACAYGAPAAA